MTVWQGDDIRAFIRIVRQEIFAQVFFVLKILLKSLWGLYQIALGAVLVGIFVGAMILLKKSRYFEVKALAKKNPETTAFMLQERERIAGDTALLKSILERREKDSAKDPDAAKDLLWHEWLPLDSMPQLIRELTLIAEDGRFYQHEGFDWRELQYALVTNYQQGKNARGASTISQQVVKNLFLESEKSYERKLKEALMTVLLEEYLTKDRILEIYLNVAQFGPGVFGVKVGARYHFHKNLEELTFNESIDLIAMLPSPVKWHPHSSLRTYRRHRMRIIKNYALYNRHKKDLPDDVLQRFEEYAEQESQLRWKQLQNQSGGAASLDSILSRKNDSAAPDEAPEP